jgi:ribosome-binding protein aMBF1 (putative translation factor)
MTSLAGLKARLMTDPEVRAEYERLGPVYELVGAMVEARRKAGLSQSDLARRIGTTQSAIARLENAYHMPSLEMLSRYAAALGRRLDIRLA